MSLHLRDGRIDEIASIVTIANAYDNLTSAAYRGVCPFTVIECLRMTVSTSTIPTIMTFLSNIVNTFIVNRVVMLNNGLYR